MAERGRETLRFGPMKPVGLDDPRTGRWPYAVVQLRQDNALGTLWNMVGFQTKLKHAEQVRIFRMIPGLENAEFARLGGLHRNTFLNSPKLLDGQLRLRKQPRLRFAGQITGRRGLRGERRHRTCSRGASQRREQLGQALDAPPPDDRARGAARRTSPAGIWLPRRKADSRSFQPMNINYGLLPPLEAPTTGPDGKRLKGKERGVREKARHVAARARRYRRVARARGRDGEGELEFLPSRRTGGVNAVLAIPGP